MKHSLAILKGIGVDPRAYLTKVSPLPAIEYDKRQQKAVLEKFDMKRYKSERTNIKLKKQFFGKQQSFVSHLDGTRGKSILSTENVCFICMCVNIVRRGCACVELLNGIIWCVAE